jgi:hypothetical protein
MALIAERRLAASRHTADESNNSFINPYVDTKPAWVRVQLRWKSSSESRSDRNMLRQTADEARDPLVASALSKRKRLPMPPLDRVYTYI